MSKASVHNWHEYLWRVYVWVYACWMWARMRVCTAPRVCTLVLFIIMRNCERMHLFTISQISYPSFPFAPHQFSSTYTLHLSYRNIQQIAIPPRAITCVCWGAGHSYKSRCTFSLGHCWFVIRFFNNLLFDCQVDIPIDSQINFQIDYFFEFFRLILKSITKSIYKSIIDFLINLQRIDFQSNLQIKFLIQFTNRLSIWSAIQTQL